MSAQAAGKVAAQAAKGAARAADGHVLNKGAKRDPELYVSNKLHLATPVYFAAILCFIIEIPLRELD